VVPGHSPAPTLEPGPMLWPGMVSAIRADPDNRHLLLTLDVPGGPPGCAIKARALVEARPAAVAVRTMFTSTLPDGADCPGHGHLTASVTIPALKNRTLLVDDKAWARSPGTADFAPCDKPLGCPPPTSS
jgi:hypothetical protein